MPTEDEKFMQTAIHLAKRAAAVGDVPIGCVIVQNGKIIARGWNQRNKKHAVLGHAELLAIGKASEKTGDWRLEDCTLYVTLEPCPMCAGAILQARIPRVVIGCMNPKAGSAGSVINLLEMQGFNHRVQVDRGVLSTTCSELLSGFFAELRRAEKAQKGKGLDGKTQVMYTKGD